MDAALSPVLAGALKATSALLVSRAWTRAPYLSPRRRRAREVARDLTILDLTSHLSLLPLVGSLPSGINLAQIDKALAQDETQAAIQEILVSALTEDGRGAFSRQSKENLARSLELQFGLQNQLAPNTFFDSVAGLIEQAVVDMIQEVQRLHPQSLDALREKLRNAVWGISLESTTAHAASITAAMACSAGALEDFQNAYRKQVTYAHGSITPPDFERKRRIPFGDLYVSPRILRNSEEGVNGNSSVGVLEFSNLIDRTVLLGDPGGGKSTAAQYIMFTMASSEMDKVPFIVTLRDFATADGESSSVVEYLETRCRKHYQVVVPDGVIEYLLHSGKALLVFDGLDELVDTSRRREMSERVELFASRYPLCKMLVTSRIVGYSQACLNENIFETFVLGGFSSEDVGEYVKKWFACLGDMDEDVDGISEDFLIESANVTDLVSTPLILALMCIIYRGQGYLPRNRPEVYERCATLLFEKWDSSRKIHVELRAAAHVDTAIKHLAFWMLTVQGGSEAVDERALIIETERCLQNEIENERERLNAAKEFVDFCAGRAWVFSDAGTTAEGERLFKFTHRTFMEYFAAFELTRITDGPEKLAKRLLPRLAAAEWEVVAELAVQISNRNSRDGAERIFQVLLKDQRKRKPTNRANILTFMARCLAFIPASPATARTIVERLLGVCVEMCLEDRGFSVVTLSGIFRVAPELRETVANELGSRLTAALRTGSETEARFARTFIMSAEIFSPSRVAGSRRGDQREYWSAWVKDLVDREWAFIFDRSLSNRWTWDSGLHQRRVSMSQYLQMIREWDIGPLAALVTSAEWDNNARPFLYVPWARQVAARLCSRAPTLPTGSRGPTENDLERDLVILSRSFSDAGPPFPGRPIYEFGLGLGQWDGPLDFSDTGMCEDAEWALWIMLCALLEGGSSLGGLERSSLEGLSEFERQALMLRGVGALGAKESIDDFLQGSRFEKLRGDRMEFCYAWLSGTRSVWAQS